MFACNSNERLRRVLTHGETHAAPLMAFISNRFISVTCFFQAYHKANEERKNYVMEINSTKGAFGAFETVRVRQKPGMDYGDNESPRMG